MARPKGLIKYTGTLYGVSSYRDRLNGTVLRSPGGPSAHQIATLDSCRPVRNNIAEFGVASTIASQLLLALKPLRGSADSRLYPRLVSALRIAIGKDSLHEPGERILHPGNIALLKPLRLNKATPADRAFRFPVSYTLEGGQLQVTLRSKLPQHVESATHFRVSSLLVQVYPAFVQDYGFDLRESEYLPADEEGHSNPHSFVHEGAHPDAMLVYGAAIRYYMLVNRGYYSLSGHRLNTGFITGIGQRWPLTGNEINIT